MRTTNYFSEQKPVLRYRWPYRQIVGIGLVLSSFFSLNVYAQSNGVSRFGQPSDSSFSPIAFIENKGQWPSEVKFQLQSSNETVWMTDTGIRFNIYETLLHPDELNDVASKVTSENRIHGHVVDLTFIGNTGTYTATEKNKKEAYYNYLIGNDPDKWVQRVGLYTEIKQENVWDGIAIRYYGNQEGKLEYDFILEPESELSELKFKFSGQDSLWLNDQGELILGTALGELTISAPFAYQIINGTRKELRSEYVWNEDGTFGFQFPDGYDQSVQTVIDPVLQWATFLHSYWSNDYIRGLDTDSNNNPIVCGYTLASDFPVTPGSYDVTHNNLDDCFISKLSSDGSSLLFSTFIGGTGNEVAISIDLDSGDNPVITGYTGSADFPVTPGAYDPTNNQFDGFVCKLSADGTSLQFSTFIGGSNADQATCIQLDVNDNPIITGFTYSTDFPATPLSFDQSANGIIDAFVSKLASNGSTLLYSSYIGGENADFSFSLALDTFGNPFITGYSSSDFFPTTSGAFDETRNGFSDAFVSAININSGTLLFSTFIGGQNGDFSNSITLDPVGNVIIGGTSYSPDYPITPNAYDQTLSEQISGDATVTKLSADGSSLLFSTFLGGMNADIAHDVFLDGNWDILVLGETKSANFPITNDAFDNSHNGEFDVFINKLSADGSLLLYSSFYGGNESDYPRYGNIIPDENCVLFTTTTHSTDIPTTSGSYQEDKLNATQDTPMIVKFCDLITPATDCPAGNIPPSDPQLVTCFTGDPISLNNLPINAVPPGSVISWHSATPPDSSNLMADITSVGPGIYFVAFYDSLNNCYSPAGAIPVYPSPEAAFDYINECQSVPTLFSDLSISTSGQIVEWNWSFGDNSSSSDQDPTHVFSGNSNPNITLIVQSAFGCSDTVSQMITLTEDPVASFTYNLIDPAISQLEMQFNNNSLYATDYNWSFNGTDNTSATNPSFTFPAANGSYTVVLIASSGTCADTATAIVTINDPMTYHVPNIFTPDADGINDVFTIFTHNASDMEAIILNRWGQEVAVLDGITAKWDGTVNGNPASEGVYFVSYTIIDTKGVEIAGQGFMELIRK